MNFLTKNVESRSKVVAGLNSYFCTRTLKFIAIDSKNMGTISNTDYGGE